MEKGGENYTNLWITLYNKTMFLGEYTHSIDQKKRLAIPIKFRNEAGNVVVITRGLDSCLFVFPVAEWEKLVKTLRSLPLGQGDARGFSRLMFSGAMEVAVDRLGRILVPDYLKEYAHLEKQVVVTGVSDRMEVWDVDKWNEYKSKSEKEIGTMAERLSELGPITMVHTPVMVQEVLKQLALQQGDVVVDATAGTGGHAIELAKQVGKKGTVVAIERDNEEIDVLCKRIAEHNLCSNVIVAGGNYADMDVICQEEGVENVSGVLFDLGFSSWHIEESGRGFSFTKNEPLDMRYEQNDESSVSAYDIVNSSSREQIKNILLEYGEEPKADAIARVITKERKKGIIKTTGDLVQIITRIAKARPGMHPATRSFQALRIAVNDELRCLEKGLESALSVVSSTGRIVVISFHSLEDRIVKHTFKEWEESGAGKVLTKKVITPHFSEKQKNRRARSAKMRVFSVQYDS